MQEVVPRIPQIIPANRDRPGRTVAAELAGDVEVELDTLRKRLGETAFEVWWQMLLCRSEGGGQFHGTLKLLAFRLEKTERAIRHALARLKQSGLVTDGGWARLEVYSGTRVVERTVYCRTVRGAVIRDDVATVPRRVALWLGSTTGHGGSRDGAGRPRKIKTVGTSAPRTYADLEIKTGTRPSAARNQDGRTIVKGSLDNTPTCVAYGNGARSEPERAVFASLPSTELVRSHDDTTSRMGTPRPAPPPIMIGGPIPPYPGASMIRPAVLPPPPQIPDELDDDFELARVLVTTYNAAITKRLTKCSVLKGDKALRNSKWLPALAKAARLLREKRIAPGAWLAFWLDGRIASGDTKRPPITVYFSAKFVGDQRKRWVFRKSCPHYGSRVVFGEKHKELITRYEEMRFALRSSAVTTLADVERVVAAHFPPGQWALMVEAAQKEAKATQVLYASALADGEFLW